MSRELLGATDLATVPGGLGGGRALGAGVRGCCRGTWAHPTPRHSPPTVAVGPRDAHCSGEDSWVQHPGVPLWLGGALNTPRVLLGTPIPGCADLSPSRPDRVCWVSLCSRQLPAVRSPPAARVGDRGAVGG